MGKIISKRFVGKLGWYLNVLRLVQFTSSAKTSFKMP